MPQSVDGAAHVQCQEEICYAQIKTNLVNTFYVLLTVFPIFFSHFFFLATEKKKKKISLKKKVPNGQNCYA